MKVLAINGSPRKDGNTNDLINIVLDEIKKENIEVESLNLAGKKINGCIACMKCFENKDEKCNVKNDDFNEIIEKMKNADGIILGSPDYFGNVTTAMKSLIDRSGIVGMANDYLFKRKVGAGVVAVRRGGAVTAINSINNLFALNQFVVPNSSYWNIGFGFMKGETSNDEEGIATMKTLGENFAWVLTKLNS